MEMDLTAQEFLMECVKDPLIPYIEKLEKSKGIYDKLVELFYESAIRKIISLLYKLKVSNDEGISSYLSKASQIRTQLQDLGEMISDKEMISIILNALIDEQGNLISNKEGEAIPFIKLWSLCKTKEERLKGESDKRSNERDQTVTKGKGEFGKFGPQKKKKNMAKVQCYRFQEYGHYRRDCPIRDNNKRNKEEAHIVEEIEEFETNKPKEEMKDLYYD